jgi:hypothetical protein
MTTAEIIAVSIIIGALIAQAYIVITFIKITIKRK